MKKTLQKYTHQFKCMTTPCEVQLYAWKKKDAYRVAHLIEQNTRRLEDKYNFFSKDSLLTQLNTRKTNRIDIDQETRDILCLIRDLSEKTTHCFDITVGTLKQCSKLPTIEAVESCQNRLKPLIGHDKWAVSENTIEFFNKEVKLDLGGVIKEYAVDQAAAIAQKENMSALINFGGDIYVNGSKPDGTKFSVAIKNPKDPSQNIAILQLSDQGLTTSAHYERSTLIEGKNYSHIMAGSAQSDQSPATNILSATVISESVLTSGVYSTSLMIKPTLAVSNDINVILVDEQLRLHQNITG